MPASDPVTAHVVEETTAAPSRAQGALAGLLAAAAALVASELVGLVLPDHPSLLHGVGDRIITAVPDGVREGLIQLVGTLDKPLLLTGIVVLLLAGGAVLGAAARQRPAQFRVAVVVVAIVAAAFAIGTSAATVVGTVLIAGVGALVGQSVYVRLLTGHRVPTAAPRPAPAGVALSRRAFLWAATGVVAGTGVIVLARRTFASGIDALRAAIVLPRPVVADPPVPAGANVAGIAPAVTSNADFYRIDTALYLPQVDPSGWSLALGGMVARPRSWSYAQLMALPQEERLVTLTCVSNQVGGDLVGNARWQGVPLRYLLELAGGPTRGAEQVVGTSADGFTAAFPLELALDGREPFVAVAMNGEPLPVEHGFPARLVVPGLYGYVSATKWLTQIQLTALGEPGYWVQLGWSPDGRISAASRIDRPGSGDQLPAGQVVVAGRAWHQHVGVGGVQVQVDNGPWQTATLADGMGTNAWRLWSYVWTATPGAHRLQVRMLDPDGSVQSSVVRPVFPGASSGLDSISVTIT
jgi:DMSO/TMAO reductase YedYZ molybdopterin-dependent catalytic subunit